MKRNRKQIEEMKEGGDITVKNRLAIVQPMTTTPKRIKR